MPINIENKELETDSQVAYIHSVAGEYANTEKTECLRPSDPTVVQ